MLGHIPRLAVIVIGTDGQVALANKGRIDVIVTVRGQATHSSMPWTGIDAIAGARQVLDHVPVTLLGLLTLPLLLGLLLAYGLGRQDHVLLGVSVCGLALIGLALLAVGFTSLCLWASAGRREQPPLELEAGVPVRPTERVGAAA